MKQRNTGLHVGKYRKQPDFKTNLAVMVLPAALIFCALVGLLITVTGLSSILPLFASGLIFLTLFTLAKHFRKELILLPAALVVLIIMVCFARSLLLNGFAALWNETRDLWAAEQSVLLPLAQTDGSGRWLASILLGLFLAALSLTLSRVPTLASTLLIVLTVAAGFIHISAWLFVSAGIALLLLAWQKNTVSVVNFLLLGAVVLGIAALVLQAGTMQNLSQTAKDALHHWRYEKTEILPEGDLTKPVPSADGTEAILSVTSDKTDTLYLRGFVGDTYKNGTWSALDAETAAAEKDLFYWLHENGFYPQSQLATAARLMDNYQSGSVSVQNLSGCSLYRYEPCTVLPERAGLTKRKIQPSAVETSGLHGARTYSYATVSDVAALLPELLDFLQNDTSTGTNTYLQMESAYREFVYSYALDVPAAFHAQLGSALDACCESYGPVDSLTKEQAQAAALVFLEECFNGTGDIVLPLADTADGTTYQYATVATLALRYYGIPARYVEGFTVKTAENENVSVTDENAGAWVEVYQDGVGWLPLALTPGLESLAPEQTESGIKPVGTGEGEGSGPRVTEGQEPEQDDAEQSEDPDNTPDGGQRTGLLAKPAFWILLIAGILLLFILFILIRHHIILKNRQKTFDDPDNSESISSLFSDAAKLLSALGFDRNGGSMLTLYGPISGRFGEETANAFRAMVFLNEKALFSSKTPDDPEREMMRNFHGTVLNLLKTNTKWPRKLRLKWLNCLY